MRFKPCPRHAFTDTKRKRAALAHKQRREREALPLFATQIAAAQPHPDAIMAERRAASDLQEQRDRDRRANRWRQARGMLAALPLSQRHALRTAWNCAPYPGDPDRLLGFIQMFAQGRLDLKRLPFPLSRTDGSGARIEDLFATDSDWRFINILRCRQIAERPDSASLADRRAAYHHLQRAAHLNKDRMRGNADRLLAAGLWPRLGSLDAEVRRGWAE